jgi:hypothetical protein
MMAGPAGASGTQPGAAMPVAGQMLGNMAGAGGGALGSALGGIAGAAAGEGLRTIIGQTMGVNDSKSVLDQMVAKGKSAAVSEATGLALNGILSMTMNAVKPTANKMLNSIMNPARDVLKREPNLGTEVMNRGVYGNPQQILDKANSFIENSEGQLQSILQGRPETVPLSGIKVGLEKQMNSLYDAGDKKAIQSIIDDWIEPHADNGYQVVASEANDIKRQIYSKLGDRAYLSTATTTTKDSLKQLAEGLKTGVENALPNEPIKELNRGMQVMINARNAVDNVVATSSKKVGFGLSDLAYGTLGAMLGRGGGLVANAGEAIATATLGRLLASKTIRGGAAMALNSLPTEAITQAGTQGVNTGKSILTSLMH